MPTHAVATAVDKGADRAGIREEHLDVPTLVAITLVPPLFGLLALGLAQRWGQVFPGWVPGLGGRAVPRLLALIPAGVVALALITYGVLSAGVMVRSLIDGSVSWSQFAHGWAADTTVLVFAGWGAALAVATVGYHLATRPDDPTDPDAPAGRDPAQPYVTSDSLT